MNAGSAMGSGPSRDPDHLLDPEVVVPIETPADVDNHSHLSYDDGTKLLDLVDSRASNRKSGRSDTLLVLDEWATDPNYGPITDDTRVLLAGRVKDYSEKAYYCEGTFEVDMEKLRVNPDAAFNKILTMVDETEDGATEKGRKYLPKSVVEVVGSIEI